MERNEFYHRYLKAKEKKLWEKRLDVNVTTHRRAFHIQAKKINVILFSCKLFSICVNQLNFFLYLSFIIKLMQNIVNCWKNKFLFRIFPFLR